MQHRVNSKKKNGGFTLIEFMVVGVFVAIGGLILLSNINAKSDESKVTEMSDEIRRLSTEMVKCGRLYGGNYTLCNYAELRRLGYLDDTWGDGTNQNPFDGNYTTAVVAGNTNRYTIAATNVTNAAYGANLAVMWAEPSIIAPVYDNGAGSFTVTLGTR